MSLSPRNKAVHSRVWAAAKGPPRIGYWQALDRLLDAARAEGRAVALVEAADYAAFYGEERLRLAGDSVLHDPVLSAARGSMVTRADLAQSRDLQIDGTINSAGYHAATHIAEHLRELAGDPTAAEAEAPRFRNPGEEIGHRNREAVRHLLLTKPGIKNTEIAEVLGLNPVAVGKHVNRIRQQWAG